MVSTLICPPASRPNSARVRVGLDAELPHRLHAERGAGGASRRTVGEIVLQCAVEEVHVGSGVLTVDADAEPVSDDRPAVPVRIGQHSRLQQREIRVVAPVERKGRDCVGPDEIAQIGVGRVDDRRRVDDLDRLDQSADLQLSVDDDRVRDAEGDAAQYVRLES